MKKLISLLLVLSLSAFVFSCGSKTEESSSEPKVETTQEKEAEAKPEKETEEEKPESEEVNEGTVVLPKVEEQVIYDENDIKVTVKSGQLSFDVIDHVVIPITIENMSTNDIEVRMENFKINGLTIDYLDALISDGEIAAGESGDAEINVSDDVTEIMSIQEIGDIVLDLKIDSDAFDDPLMKKDVEILTSLSGKVTQEVNTEGSELINQDGIKLIVRNQMVETSIGPAVEYYFENESNTYVEFENEGNYMINGTEFDAAYSFGLEPNSKTIVREVILESDLTDAGISLPITSISFKLKANDAKVIGDEIIAPFEVKMDF